MEKICENCLLHSKEYQCCIRTKTPVVPTDYCSYFASEIIKCDVCGRAIVTPATYYTEENNEAITILCSSCMVARNQCQTCEYGSYCDFNENKECQLPPMIQQTKRQGNMIMSRTVPNMARVEETCKKNCKCYNSELNCCSRGNFGTCGNYCMNGRKVEDAVSSI